MPNLNLHYSSNLAGIADEAVLHELNQVAARLFDESDIKTRAQPFETFRVGVAPAPRGFVHLLVAMSARGADIERGLSVALADVLQRHLEGRAGGIELQLCVEIVHVDVSTYVKRILA